MEIVKTIKALNEKLFSARNSGKSIGLVPTMGALHAGHASLIRRSVSENDITVVSDFVNPTQFNDQNDLLRYPRTFEADCQLVEAIGADYIFYPSVEEMYPEADTRTFSYPPIDSVMEGPRRPGHVAAEGSIFILHCATVDFDHGSAIARTSGDFVLTGKGQVVSAGDVGCAEGARRIGGVVGINDAGERPMQGGIARHVAGRPLILRHIDEFALDTLDGFGRNELFGIDYVFVKDNVGELRHL